MSKLLMVDGWERNELERGGGFECAASTIGSETLGAWSLDFYSSRGACSMKRE